MKVSMTYLKGVKCLKLWLLYEKWVILNKDDVFYLRKNLIEMFDELKEFYHYKKNYYINIIH